MAKATTTARATSFIVIKLSRNVFTRSCRCQMALFNFRGPCVSSHLVQSFDLDGAMAIKDEKPQSKAEEVKFYSLVYRHIQQGTKIKKV